MENRGFTGEGIVMKSTGSNYLVRLGSGETILCRIRGKLRLGGSQSTSPVVVGDRVTVDLQESGEEGIISYLHDRRNFIVRKSVNLSRQTHVIASNLDQLILVVTLILPETRIEFIDRFLATAEAYRIPAVLLFNKVDLYNEQLSAYQEELAALYSGIGYRCHKVSALTKEGIDEFAEILKDKVSLISGNSGVGKSTLVNTVEPGLKLRVSDLSDYHLKGKHTTTFSEMFELSRGGFIIDTPGIKGFGLVHIGKEELFHYFPEFFRLTGKCQFYNCTHVHEPNCAVHQALREGKIAESRFKSYLNILLDEDDKHRKPF